MYRPTTIPKASFANSVRLTDLVKDGKIYLSLSDAIALALENNYDIAIARYDLDIADTDILRTRTGAAPLGAPSGLITNTLGGSASTLTHRRRSGRNHGRLGRRGFRRRRIDADHRRRGTSAGEPGTLRYRHDSVRAGRVAADQLFSSARLPEYRYIQLHLQPGLCDRHGAGRGLQQQPYDHKQPIQSSTARS